MPQPPDEVLFEFVQIGGIMRVTAVHAGTGTEVVIQGPVAVSQSNLQRAALAKLRYVIGKQKK